MSESSTPEREHPVAGFAADLQVPLPRGVGDGDALSVEPGLDVERDVEPDAGAEAEAESGADGDVDADGEPEPDAGPDSEPDPGPDPEAETEAEAETEPEEPPEPTRFEQLVEEHVRRARYAHHLTRPIFTPEESVLAVLVERRAAVWVPTMTFVATVVSAIAAVVLATRLRSDPTDPSGNQLFVVTVTVCLLAAAFATLIRAEVHYERMRPRGRVVRHDVADAYDLVRDAPRRLVRHEVPTQLLRRVADLLPAAERLIDALADYTLQGGTQVRAHPAYERMIRMRAEIEALEVLLAEQRERAAAEAEDRPERPVRPQRPQVAGLGEPVAATAGARLPRPDQVPDYTGLADLADGLLVED